MKTIIRWLEVARLPFHLAGILPFLAGSFLAFKLTGKFDPAVFFWALLALELVLFSSNVNGEIFDSVEDTISAKDGKSPFSGGSQVIIKGLIDPKKVDLASRIAILSALCIGFLLQFYYKTGPWTIPLGLTGLITGFYYSRPPLRWVKRGLGELFIAYSYGWLPVAIGFYLQTGSIAPNVHLVSIPVACSIFNVILINEFPDRFADAQAGKKNLLVRFGREKAAALYIIVSITGTVISLILLAGFFSGRASFLYLPVAVISWASSSMVASGKYKQKTLLRRICLLTLLVNIFTNLIYIAAPFI